MSQRRAWLTGGQSDVYAFRIGSMDRVPLLVRPPAQAESLSIDHRTGFLLSFIDGSATVESIADACDMPKSDAPRILYELVKRGILGFV